jgi:hypothetical protein
MQTEPAADLELLIQQSEAIEAAVQTAVRAALLDHKRAGNPVVVCDADGVVRWLQPDEIPLDDPESE